MIGPISLRAMPLAFFASVGGRACYRSATSTSPACWSSTPFRPRRSGGQHAWRCPRRPLSSASSTGEERNPPLDDTAALPFLPVTGRRQQQQQQQQPFVGSGGGDTSRRVCVLLDERNEGSVEDHEEIARDLASLLGLPLVAMADDEYDRDGDDARFSHRLTIVPHPRQCTHAVAIQPIPNPSRREGRMRSRRGGSRYQWQKPFFVDFCHGTDLARRLSGSGPGGGGNRGGGEMLLRAIAPRRIGGGGGLGVGGGSGALVYDLTAGFGRDSAVIAAASSGDDVVRRVHMVERDPIVAELLRDGLRRLDLLASSSSPSSGGAGEDISEASREIAGALSGRLELTVGDGADVARGVADAKAAAAAASGGVGSPVEVPDVCYLDPMFPPRGKRASAVKKDMQILHGLLQSQSRPQPSPRRNDDFGGAIAIEEDGFSSSSEAAVASREWRLLEAALGAASKRVVVKRPIHAPPLGSGSTDAAKPSYELRGSTNRFDVYVVGP